MGGVGGGGGVNRDRGGGAWRGFVGSSNAKSENQMPATQNAITTKCEGVDTYHSIQTALVTKSASVKVIQHNL